MFRWLMTPVLRLTQQHHWMCAWTSLPTLSWGGGALQTLQTIKPLHADSSSLVQDCSKVRTRTRKCMPDIHTLCIYTWYSATVTRPTEPVQYDRLVCGVPAFNQSRLVSIIHTAKTSLLSSLSLSCSDDLREVLLQITLNGISYISSNVTLFVDECSVS